MFVIVRRDKRLWTFLETYKLLFGDLFRAYALAGEVLHRKGVATFKDIHVDSGLKEMGTSTRTVNKILKILQETGIIEKIKAGFPYYKAYRLKMRLPPFDALALVSSNMVHWGTQPDACKKAIEEIPEISKMAFQGVAKAFLFGWPLQASLYGFLLLDYMYGLALLAPLETLKEVLGETPAKEIEKAQLPEQLEKELYKKVFGKKEP